MGAPLASVTEAVTCPDQAAPAKANAAAQDSIEGIVEAGLGIFKMVR
jgi:hypothetical protein